MIEFSVIGWSAWAPGLPEKKDWTDWAAADALPPIGGQTPALSDIPAVQRRRIDRLGRMAITALDACDAGQRRDDVPLVFASRHGEVNGSVQLLRVLGAQDSLSPTAFSLSVHNAVAALYSIVRKRQSNYLALAAGQTSVEAACVEAFGLLADGAPEVLVVNYESPLPEVYSDFVDEPQHWHAWCWRLASSGQPGTRLRLSWGDDGQEESVTDTSVLQHGLDLHRFLLSKQSLLSYSADGQSWQWQKA